MATKVDEILRETRAFVEAKRASAANEKQALAGEDPNSLPGSEHDKKVPEEAKKQNPEITQGNPSGAFSASGAHEGDKVEMASALKANEPPPAKVDKLPQDSADINAAPKTGSAAGEIAAMVADEAFDYLDAPIKRVCAPDTPVPYSPVLEDFWIPDQKDLIEAVTQLV
jgi:hypothetical protein